jgi:hypothetical protein
MLSWQIIGKIEIRDFERALTSLGWQRDPDAVPVDPEEPKFASWSRDPDGQMEYVYNPELQARALAFRGEDAELYLRELNQLVQLQPSPLSLSQWEQAKPWDARTFALASAAIIKAQLVPLLAALRDDRSGELARLLIPRPEDYPLVFIGDAAPAARQVYERLWSDPANLWRGPSPEQREILCYVAPAGMLAYQNELSRPFPGGYQAVAGFLEPSRVWVAWKYVAQGQTSGLAYNGLVWVNEHWAWFPKPYRYLRDFILSKKPPD